MQSVKRKSGVMDTIAFEAEKKNLPLSNNLNTCTLDNNQSQIPAKSSLLSKLLNLGNPEAKNLPATEISGSLENSKEISNNSGKCEISDRPTNDEQLKVGNFIINNDHIRKTLENNINIAENNLGVKKAGISTKPAQNINSNILPSYTPRHLQKQRIGEDKSKKLTTESIKDARVLPKAFTEQGFKKIDKQTKEILKEKSYQSPDKHRFYEHSPRRKSSRKRSPSPERWFRNYIRSKETTARHKSHSSSCPSFGKSHDRSPRKRTTFTSPQQVDKKSCIHDGGLSYEDNKLQSRKRPHSPKELLDADKSSSKSSNETLSERKPIRFGIGPSLRKGGILKSLPSVKNVFSKKRESKDTVPGQKSLNNDATAEKEKTQKQTEAKFSSLNKVSQKPNHLDEIFNSPPKIEKTNNYKGNNFSGQQVGNNLCTAPTSSIPQMDVPLNPPQNPQQPSSSNWNDMSQFYQPPQYYPQFPQNFSQIPVTYPYNMQTFNTKMPPNFYFNPMFLSPYSNQETYMHHQHPQTFYFGTNPPFVPRTRFVPVNTRKQMEKPANSLKPSLLPTTPKISTQVTKKGTVSEKVILEHEIHSSDPRLAKKYAQKMPENVQRMEKVDFIKSVAGKETANETTSKNAILDPAKVCYTLSSDEKEPVSIPYNSVLDESMNASNVYPMESEGSKSDRSSTSDVIPDENLDYDDPQFPGVTDINPRIGIEEEEDEEEEEEPDEEGMEFEGEDPEPEREPGFDEEVDDEEMPVDEEEEEERQRLILLQQKALEGKLPTDYPIKCRSIRIGSYKVHPHVTMSCLPVVLKEDSIAFQVPIVSQPNKNVWIHMKSNDIQQAIVHFGRCLPVMFVFTSPSFGETVRKGLHMVSKDQAYFDPTSEDDKIKKITFLIESVEDPQKEFIRHVFPGDKKIREVDQKMANEILVRSTPKLGESKIVKLQPEPVTLPLTVTVESQVTTPPNIPSQLSVTKIIVPQQPIVKLLTYPPPPQTGGIAITSEDLACLNEGEFLNDVIIDFYLKYIFFEKLSPSQREKTHIFSSFFYPRLTHKPDRVRPGDDQGKPPVQVRRHNQVKTWTRHVDIFSKDFIIIPVNQNVHWFLAIICYPGRVPETTSIPLPESKSPDNVTSTDEQENTNRLVIKELSSNGEGVGDSPNQDDNSTGSASSPYEVEESPDSDELSSEAPDISTHPDGKQGKEMPCICIFDSLSGPSRWKIPAHLRDYLEMEWKSKKGSKKIFNRNTMQEFIMKCPQQTNYSDCGMYLLQFVESFFENPLPYFGTPMPDLTNWFSEEKISKKKLLVQELILKLQKKQQASVAANARKVNQTDRTHLSSPVLQTNNR